MARTQDSSTFAIPITKIAKQNDGSLVVEGVVTDDILDRDEQIVDGNWAKSALQKWYAEAANIRQMHSPFTPPAGKAFELDLVSGPPSIKAKIVNKDAIALTEAGVYQGFSIGIVGEQLQFDPAAPNGRIVGGDINEVSLVDYPACPTAVLSLCKRAKSGEFKITQKIYNSKKGISVEDDNESGITKDATTPQSIAASLVTATKAAMKAADDEKWDKATALANAAVGMSDTLKPLVKGTQLDARNRLDKLLDQCTQAWFAGTYPDGLEGQLKNAIEYIKLVIGTEVNDIIPPATPPQTGKSKGTADDAPPDGNRTSALTAQANEGDDTKVPCPLCGGKGKIRQGHLECPECKGTGKVSKEEALAYHAKKTAKAAKKIAKDVDKMTKTAKAKDENVGDNNGEGVDRSKLDPDKDFVFPKDAPDGGFPIASPDDVSDAVSSWGRYKGPETFDTFKANLIALCEKKGSEFVKELPDSWADDIKEYESKGDDNKDKSSDDKTSGKGKTLADGAGGEAMTDDKDDNADASDEPDCEDKKCGKCKSCKAATKSASKDDGDADSDVSDALDDVSDDLGDLMDDLNTALAAQAIDTGTDAGDGDDDNDGKSKKKKLATIAPKTKPDTSKASKKAQKALASVPYYDLALHDLLCPAYSGKSVSKAHPIVKSGLPGLIGVPRLTDEVQGLASVDRIDAQALSRKSAHLAAAGQIASLDLKQIEKYHARAHKVFESEYPSVTVKPGSITPEMFRRNYLKGDTPATAVAGQSPHIPQAKPISAEQFDRGAIVGSGQERQSPEYTEMVGNGTTTGKGKKKKNKSKKGGSQAPQPRSSREFYTNSAKDKNEAAMTVLHDHIAQTFPHICSLSQAGQDPTGQDQSGSLVTSRDNGSNLSPQTTDLNSGQSGTLRPVSSVGKTFGTNVDRPTLIKQVVTDFVDSATAPIKQENIQLRKEIAKLSAQLDPKASVKRGSAPGNFKAFGKKQTAKKQAQQNKRAQQIDTLVLKAKSYNPTVANPAFEELATLLPAEQVAQLLTNNK